MDARTLRKKSKRDLKEEQIQILLTQEEKTKIQEQAKIFRLPTSTYIRLKVLGIIGQSPDKT